MENSSTSDDAFGAPLPPHQTNSIQEPVLPPAPENDCPDEQPLASPEAWQAGLAFLEENLVRDGRVSMRSFNAHMERTVDAEVARAIGQTLRFYKPSEGNLPPTFVPPKFEYLHHRASFFTPENYEAFRQQADNVPNSTESETTQRSPRRQEEARMGRYIVECLSDIYVNDFSGDQVAFDVHSARPRNSYENVDQLGVFWRSPRHAEVLAVEAKLQFCPQLVHQARNYCRFAHRVWIAVPVTTGPENAATDIQLQDPLLFEYVLDQGIGILACRKRPGSSYDVFPVHWPRKQAVDQVELDAFVDAYWDQFEAARFVSRRQPYAA